MEALGRGKRKLGVDDNPELPERLRVEDEEEEEREIQELEREVSEMARRVLDARKTNLDRILGGLSSQLVAKRPPLPPRALAVSDAGETEIPSFEPNGGRVLGNADQTMVEKLLVFRARMESIISETPVVLKRANDCILKIEKLEKCDIFQLSSKMQQRSDLERQAVPYKKSLSQVKAEIDFAAQSSSARAGSCS